MAVRLLVSMILLVACVWLGVQAMAAPASSLPVTAEDTLKEELSAFLAGELGKDDPALVEVKHLDLSPAVNAGHSVSVVSHSVLELDKDHQTFQVALAMQGGTIVTAEGRYALLQRVPVLKRKFSEGDIIRKQDIAWQNVYSRRIHDDIVTDPAMVIGKTPVRVLSADRPMRVSQIQQIPAVERGQLVTLRFQAGGLEIRDVGEAMEDGRIGDAVAVRNEKSRKVLRGVISAQGVVDMTPGHLMPGGQPKARQQARRQPLQYQEDGVQRQVGDTHPAEEARRLLPVTLNGGV